MTLGSTFLMFIFSLSYCFVLPQIGYDQRANSTGSRTPLQVPPAISADATCWQLFRFLVIRIRSQHTVNDAASTVFPLQTTALDTSVSKPETLFRLAPLKHKLYKKIINY